MDRSKQKLQKLLGGHFLCLLNEPSILDDLKEFRAILISFLSDVNLFTLKFSIPPPFNFKLHFLELEFSPIKSGKIKGSAAFSLRLKNYPGPLHLFYF